MYDPFSITDRERLLELLSRRDQGEPVPNEAEMREAILARVRGQDHVVDDVVRLIRLQKAKILRDRPVANLLFLGETGTGKTELAKSIAAALYGDEGRLVRFDCGELTAEQGKTRLIGSSRGYVGSDQGGELTRRILNNPNQVVVFDEVEKASNDVFDLFLAMMGEGRLTEQGTGRVADFTKAIIILTSNLEHEAIGRIHDELADPYERVDAIKKHLRDIKAFRPEILGRFDRLYYFRPLPIEVLAEIALLKATKVAEQYGLVLDYIDPNLVFEALSANQKVAAFGTRELIRIVENMFGEGMLHARQSGAIRIAIRRDIDGRPDVCPVEPPETAVAGGGDSKPRPDSLQAFPRRGAAPRHPLELPT